MRARIRALRALDPVPAIDFRAAVRDLVVIGSSSRGGSSIFAEALRRHPGLLHFRAEVNPFLVLEGRAFPGSGTGSDALGAWHAAGFDAGELAADCGSPVATLSGDAEIWSFSVDLACRLTMQWPEQRFEAELIRGCVEESLAELGWAGAFPDAALFHAVFLARLRVAHPDVNPWFYDIDPAMLADLCPGAAPSDRAPSSVVVEEPPFVTIRPWRRATAEELATRPLLMKTPGNVYRMPFYEALFPAARLRLIHLTRNVAASVNGLYDGWRFGGFHAHAIAHGIQGVADHSWWKFDLPPGWEAWTARPLEEVCAFQWRSAHTALLAWADAHPDVLRLRFEDVLETEAVLQRLFAWLGAEERPGLTRDLPVVMATGRPRQRRWFQRAALFEQILSDPANRALMERLGYDPDPATWT